MSSLFGYAIASDLPMERLAPEAGVRGELGVEVAPVAAEGEELARFDGCALLRAPEGPIVECELTGTFLVDPAQRRVVADPAPCGAVDLEHRLVATALPLLAAELGDIVLHASSIVVDGAAVLFCGPSGRGKSTIAMAVDAPVLSEDGTVITLAGGPLAWPGPIGVRLRDGDRRVVSEAPRASEPARISAIVVLAPRGGGKATTERLAPAEAVAELAPHVVTAEPPLVAAGFRRAVRLANAIPVWRGRMPDDLVAAGSSARRLLSAAL